jgi:Ca2+-transporting ATPase
LLAGSFGEVVLIVGSLIAGMPLAVLPVQILWVNLIQDTFPNMALGFDRGEAGNMHEKPRKKNEFIIDREMKILLSIIIVISNAILFSLFVYFLKSTGDIALTRTIMFLGLTINSLLYIYSVRSMRYHVWEMNPFNNMYLNLALLFAWLMLVLAIYLPPLQILLRTVSLEWWHWGVMIGFGIINMLLIEIVKTLFIKKGNLIK